MIFLNHISYLFGYISILQITKKKTVVKSKPQVMDLNIGNIMTTVQWSVINVHTLELFTDATWVLLILCSYK